MDLMKLRPNKALIWKELKNNWVLILLFWVFISFVSSYTLIDEIATYKKLLDHCIYDMSDIHRLLIFNKAFVGIFSTLLVIMLASTIMGQERDRDTFNLLLAMPYTRQEIIYNKFFIGLGQLPLIFIFNALVMTVIMRFNTGIHFPFTVGDIWFWALHNVIILSFIFVFTMLISCISGTTLGNILFSTIFLFFPYYIAQLIDVNFQDWCWGLGLTIGDPYKPSLDVILTDPLLEIGSLLTVPFYLIDINHYINGKEVVESFALLFYSIIIILTVTIYFFTQYLFAKNHMEQNGEVLMFNQLEGFFKLGVAVCFALLGEILILELFQLNDYGEDQNYFRLIVSAISYLLIGGISWLIVDRIIKRRKPV